MRTLQRAAAVCVAIVVLVFAVRSFPIQGAGSGTDANWTTNAAGDRFIVHEWGTFTSFSGSDSVKLEFRPLVDADLPLFVLDRGRQSGKYNPFSKVSMFVRQRMETPVTYFYSDRVRQVQARVEFPQGLLTEFYPPVAEMLPDVNPQQPDKLTNSALDWGNLWIIPEERLQVAADEPTMGRELRERLLAKLLPAAYEHEHYAYARETDAALVTVERTKDAQRKFAPTGNFFEKFLFYRGVGNFDLPLSLKAKSGGQFELLNDGPAPIRGLFLVTLQNDELRFTSYDQILPGARLTLSQSGAFSSPSELADAVTKTLIAEGLYEKEAKAMVKTWCASWFGEQGTRLFYLLPQATTEKLLPLTITPTPDEMVRVMVGRLEIMTPEEEQRVTELVQASARARAAAAAARESNPDAPAYQPPESFHALGRLAEPALVRVRNISPTPELRHEASLLLNELQLLRNQTAQFDWWE